MDILSFDEGLDNQTILIRVGEWIHFIDESRRSKDQKMLIKGPFEQRSIDHMSSSKQMTR